jgi:MFS family permease
MCFGFGVAYPSPAGPTLFRDVDFDKMERNVFNSVMSLVSVLGPTASNYLLNRFGRRSALRSTALVALLSWLILLSTPLLHKWCAIVHRGFLGLSQGG